MPKEKSKKYEHWASKQDDFERFIKRVKTVRQTFLTNNCHEVPKTKNT